MGFCCVFGNFDYFLTTQKNPFTHPLTHPKTRGWVDILKNPGFFPTLSTALALCRGYYLQITKLKAFEISSVCHFTFLNHFTCRCIKKRFYFRLCISNISQWFIKIFKNVKWKTEEISNAFNLVICKFIYGNTFLK
jgi:hypothetical protein